jgi:Holliday junction resolvasome RuvABC endonuclease subunit
MGDSKDKRIEIDGVFSEDDSDGSKVKEDIEEVGLKEDSFSGLDLSLTSSGVCVKTGGVFVINTVKTDPKNFKNDLARMIYIRDRVVEKIPKGTKMICIEDVFAGPSMGAGQRLAMLGAIVRVSLYEKGFSFLVCAPSTLKKHVLGKGTGEKSLILRAVYQSYGLNVANDNESDSVVLCGIGEQFYKTLVGDKLDGIPKYQQEVIKGLMVKKDERGYNLPQI